MNDLTEAQRDGINAVRDMIASGDETLGRYKDVYRRVYERETTLTDEQIIVMIGTAEDDKDEADWAVTMYELETKALVDSHS